MIRMLLVSFGILLTACTINIMQTDTHGSATDVVDSDAKANADLKADLSLPLKGL
jgi:hypothetical protein